MQFTVSRRNLGKGPLTLILKFLTFSEHCSIAAANHETIYELKKNWKFTSKIDAYGTTRYYVNNLQHRFGGPAIEYTNGSYIYMWADKIHRLRGPAVKIFASTEEWWQYGQMHRDDGPATTTSDGRKAWHFRGIFQRYEQDEVSAKIKDRKLNDAVLAIW